MLCLVDLGKATDLREPGFYAGYLVSANQVGRILTSVLWGRFSDKHGRKPVLLYGLGVTGLSALLFGLAARSREAPAARSCLGDPLELEEAG